MKIISQLACQSSSEFINELGRYRRKVFVETLKWNIPIKEGLEQDQFDRQDTVYIIAKDQMDEIVGCARLLPTNRPYLLGDVFLQLLDGASPPASPQVWELSRFAAVCFGRKQESRYSQFSSRVAVQLLRATMECAERYGARRLITVSPVGVSRLLRAAGFCATMVGAPMKVDGRYVAGYWINI